MVPECMRDLPGSRAAWVSASRVAAAFDMDPYRSPIELALELRGEVIPVVVAPEREVNHPLVRGKLLESAIIEAGRRLLEQWLIDDGQGAAVPVRAHVMALPGEQREAEEEWYHPRLPWSAHPDVLYIDALDRWWVADAKSSATWIAALDTEEGKRWTLRRKFDRCGDVPPTVYSQRHVVWDLATEYSRMPGCPFACRDVMMTALVPLCELGNSRSPFSLLHVPIDLDFLTFLAEGTQGFIDRHCAPDSPLPEPGEGLDSAALALWTARQPDQGEVALSEPARLIWQRYKALLDARKGWLTRDGDFIAQPEGVEEAREFEDDGEVVTLSEKAWNEDKKQAGLDLLKMYPRAIVTDSSGLVIFQTKVIKRAPTAGSEFATVETRVSGLNKKRVKR